MRQFYFLILLGTFILIPLSLFPQDVAYFLKSYTTDNGLANNNVKSIGKDRNGFLWMATFDGISRFDGYEFKNYYNDPADTTGLADIDYQSVLVDGDNNVWVKGGVSLYLYDRSQDRFLRISRKTAGKTNSDQVYCIALGPDLHLWVSGNSGMEKFIGNRFIRYEIHSTFPATINITSFSIDDKYNFWFLSDGIFYQGYINDHLDPKSTHLEINKSYIFRNPYFNATQSSIDYPSVYNFFSGRNKSTWLASNFGLYRLDTLSKSFELYSHTLPDLEFRNHDRILWTIPGEGLYVYLKSTGNILRIIDEKNLFIYSLYYDNGIIWFGGIRSTSEGIGLNQLTFTGNFFKTLLLKDKGQSKPAVFAVIRDDRGILWVGCRNNNFIYRIGKDKTINECLYLTDQQVARGKHPRSFLRVNGKMWMGFYEGLMIVFDPHNNISDLKNAAAEDLRNLNFPDSMTSFKLMVRDKRGNILIGGSRYFSSIDYAGQKIIFGTSLPEPNQRIFSILNDKDTNYWLGSVGELLFFRKDFSQFKKFPVWNVKYNVESMVDGDSSVLWLALLGGGLGRFDKTTGKTRILSVRDGLANNVTYNLLKDRHGNLWISTNKGVSMYNPKSCLFRNFGMADGLKIQEFNADAAFQGADGEMIFGGMGGIVSFFPDSLMESGKGIKPSLVITDFKVSGNPVYFKKGIYEMDRITLEKGVDNFLLSFACIDFRDAENIRYRHRLSGLNESWTLSGGNHRFVNYSGLTPGSYLFQVEATDLQGDWNYRTNLEIIIPPYFYQTSAFKVFIIILGILLLGSVYSIRERNIRLKERKKYAILKMESLRNQMNPHFIFNSLNSINYFISVSDKLAANQYITGFSRLIRSILDNSGNEFIPLEKEIESLEDYFRLEHLRFGDKFDYHIVIDENIPVATIQVAPSLVQPFVENAIWHGVRNLEGRKGVVTVHYSMTDFTFITCQITDDGVGREGSQKKKSDEQRKHHSRGISIVEERLRIRNSIQKKDLKLSIQDLYTESEDTGTKVSIDIPIKSDVA